MGLAENQVPKHVMVYHHFFCLDGHCGGNFGGKKRQFQTGSVLEVTWGGTSATDPGWIDQGAFCQQLFGALNNNG